MKSRVRPTFLVMHKYLFTSFGMRFIIFLKLSWLARPGQARREPTLDSACHMELMMIIIMTMTMTGGGAAAATVPVHTMLLFSFSIMNNSDCGSF